jgi:hypothetical protein
MKRPLPPNVFCFVTCMSYNVFVFNRVTVAAQWTTQGRTARGSKLVSFRSARLKVAKRIIQMVTPGSARIRHGFKVSFHLHHLTQQPPIARQQIRWLQHSRLPVVIKLPPSYRHHLFQFFSWLSVLDPLPNLWESEIEIAGMTSHICRSWSNNLWLYKYTFHEL